MAIKKVDIFRAADRYLNMSREDLKYQYDLMYPGGSGPLGVMKHAAALIVTVAILRNIDTSDW